MRRAIGSLSALMEEKNCFNVCERKKSRQTGIGALGAIRFAQKSSLNISALNCIMTADQTRYSQTSGSDLFN